MENQEVLKAVAVLADKVGRYHERLMIVERELEKHQKDKDEVSGGGAIAIPKGWVTKIEYLTVDYAEHE